MSGENVSRKQLDRGVILFGNNVSSFFSLVVTFDLFEIGFDRHRQITADDTFIYKCTLFTG